MANAMASMSLSDMNDFIIKIAPKRGASVMFRGPIGMGKSLSVLDAIRAEQARDPEFAGCAYCMANSETIDIRGFPQISTLISQYAMPQWMAPVPAEGLRGAFPALCPPELRGDPNLPEAKGGWSQGLRHLYETGPDQIAAALAGDKHALKTYPKGIAVLDEALQVVDDTVLLPLAQVFQEHRSGSWGVPTQGWAIVGLTNRMTDQAGVREVYAHVRNRIAIYDVYHDIAGSLDFWQRVGMNKFFRYFASAQKNAVFTDSIPEGQDQFTTPRSWHAAHDDLMAWLTDMEGVSSADIPTMSINPDHPMLLSFIAGRCGDGTAVAFKEFVQKMGEWPTFKSIVSSPKTAKLPATSGIIGAVIRMCVEETDPNTLAKVCQYMERSDMPSTFRAVFCQQLMRRFAVTTLFNHPGFMGLVDPAVRNLLVASMNKGK